VLKLILAKIETLNRYSQNENSLLDEFSFCEYRCLIYKVHLKASLSLYYFCHNLNALHSLCVFYVFIIFCTVIDLRRFSYVYFLLYVLAALCKIKWWWWWWWWWWWYTLFCNLLAN